VSGINEIVQWKKVYRRRSLQLRFTGCYGFNIGSSD